MRYMLFAILVMTVITFILRYLPFQIFHNRPTPRVVSYLGLALPPAIIGMLVIYCLRNIDFIGQRYYAPSELVAGLIVILLHAWKRNLLLSITVGTIINMLMKQITF